jgi:protein involved in polysaccharide export with SLBB domain
VITRRRDAELTRDLVAFSPQDVFAGRGDIALKDGDMVRLLSGKDVREVIANKNVDIPQLVTTFIHEHVVSLQGAVRVPGAWPVAGPVPIARLLDVAGGALNDADLSRVEISRNDVGLIDASMGAVSHRDVVNLSDANGVTVTFGDGVQVPDRFEAVTRQTVTLHGEVRNPGTYDLMRGDTLLTLLDRSGGLTDQAYPLGTVFSRAVERKREKEKYNVAAHDLERAIAISADNKDGKVDMEQMTMAKDLVNEMKTIDPVGRITVQSAPGILRRDPSQDILMEAGDIIYIPKRPLTVRVTGEVMNPASLQFKSEKTSRDYISEAGGPTMNADGSREFILFPDGSAQPLRSAKFTNFKPLMIIPGSTIVVPRDPKPFDFIESAKDITQILSNIAITGIYADDLMDKN